MSMYQDDMNNSVRDIDQEAERFLDELRLNTILRELTPEQRKEYYTIVNSGNHEQAEEFVNINIPDLEDKLLVRIRELLLKKDS